MKIFIQLLFLVFAVNGFAADTLTPALNRKGLSPSTGLIQVKGVPGSPIENDYKITVDGAYLDIGRYNDVLEEYEQQYRIGGSGFINDYLEIKKETAGALLISDDAGHSHNAVTLGNFNTESLIFGDIEGDTYISGKDVIYNATVSDDYAWSDLQTVETGSFTGKSFYVEATTPAGHGFVSEILDFSQVDIPADNKVQIKVYLASDLTTVVWKNVSDQVFRAGGW